VVAVYNRFPLTYPDTGNYLDNAAALAHGREPWFFFRPLTYGVFLLPFATPYTIRLVPLVQGILAALAVHLALRAAAVSLSNRGFVALFAALSVGTSLPWFSGQIMPDIFTGLVILLAFVTLWGPGRLSRLERWAAGVILTVAIASHLSHIPLYATVAIAGVATRAVLEPESRALRRLTRLAARAAAPLVVAAGLVIWPNYHFHREPVLSRSSPLFALAHLVGDGVAQRHLDRACPTRRYLLCSERDSLKADVDWFLWASEGPLQRQMPAMQRGDSTLLREARAIVIGTLREEWPAVIRAALRNAVVQLGTLGMHPGEHSLSRSVEAAMQRMGPATHQAYRTSAQLRQAIPLEGASALQYVMVGLGALMLLASLPALKGPAHAPLRAFIAMVCAGVLLNALVVASLARVHPRYQSRVVWLLPLAGAVAAGQAIGRRAQHR
jgi:hypothetical protein